MVNLKLVLQTANADSITLSDRSGNVDFKIEKLDNLVIETKIKLPNIVYINTLENNITLKELWLGNIKATDSMLIRMCCYTSNNSTTYTTHWHTPGVTKIEFFDPLSIQFHLHYGNFLQQNLYSSS